MRSKEYERKLLARARARHCIKPLQINIEALFELPEKQQTDVNVKYEPHFSELIYKMLSQGYTVIDFCKEIGIYRSKFYRWLKRYPEFNEALKVGREEAKEIWQLRCIISFYNSQTGKRLPNTSYHRLLASNIYGSDFLPPKKKLSKEANEIAELRRLLFEAG